MTSRDGNDKDSLPDQEVDQAIRSTCGRAGASADDRDCRRPQQLFCTTINGATMTDCTRPDCPLQDRPTQVITVRMPEWLHAKIKEEAARRGCSMNQLCVDLLSDPDPVDSPE